MLACALTMLRASKVGAVAARALWSGAIVHPRYAREWRNATATASRKTALSVTDIGSRRRHLRTEVDAAEARKTAQGWFREWEPTQRHAIGGERRLRPYGIGHEEPFNRFTPRSPL